MPASTRNGGRHRKHRGAKHARSASGTRRLGAAAGAALVGASLVTAGPAAAAATPTPHALRVASEQVRLTAAANILNVPINMLTDLVNIPYNEVQAVDFLSKSLYFSGAWFVVSSTNLWGVDPGDPGHFRSTFNLAIPIPALSGMNMDQDDNNGIGQQVWKAVAVMLPVSTSCDAQACTPNVPTSPITGVTSVDSLLWMGAMLTGMLQLPLTSSWFQPGPIMDMLTDGYTFGPEYEGYADPSGPVTGMFGIPGTEVGPNGEYLMPWHDETFKLDLTQPLQNYFNHLMADPSENPILLPSFEQIGRAVQNFYASSVIAFDPITAGSPFCPGTCSWLPPALDYAGIAQTISDLWPGNETLETWLDAHAAGTDNAPTAEQIARSIEILQQKGFFDFQNPSPPPEWARTFNLSSLAPAFHKMWKDFGFDVPDLNTTVTDGS